MGSGSPYLLIAIAAIAVPCGIAVRNMLRAIWEGSRAKLKKHVRLNLRQLGLLLWMVNGPVEEAPTPPVSEVMSVLHVLTPRRDDKTMEARLSRLIGSYENICINLGRVPYCKLRSTSRHGLTGLRVYRWLVPATSVAAFIIGLHLGSALLMNVCSFSGVVTAILLWDYPLISWYGQLCLKLVLLDEFRELWRS
jgi:hypothetical protein